MRDPTTLRDFDSYLWAMLQKGVKQRVTWPFHLSGSVWEIDGETSTNNKHWFGGCSNISERKMKL